MISLLKIKHQDLKELQSNKVLCLVGWKTWMYGKNRGTYDGENDRISDELLQTNIASLCKRRYYSIPSQIKNMLASNVIQDFPVSTMLIK